MFYNEWTTFSTFASKTWILELEVAALRNSKYYVTLNTLNGLVLANIGVICLFHFWSSVGLSQYLCVWNQLSVLI